MTEQNCDLCAGKCRGHQLGHPDQWEPEAGSRAWQEANPMTDKTLEAVARAIGNTTDFDGDRMASRYADSELRDMAQAAITAARPLILGDEREAVVNWLRDQDGHGYDEMRADCIEAREHLRGGE